jgi:hypothetical protein
LIVYPSKLYSSWLMIPLPLQILLDYSCFM